MKLQLDLNRFRVDTDAWSATAAAVLAGVFFFLRAVWYFGFVNLRDCGTWELIGRMILPMVLTGALMILLRGVKLKWGVVYGGIGLAICVFLLIWCFDLSGVSLVLNFILLLLGDLCLAAECLGVLGSRWYALGACLGALVCRVLFWDLPRLAQLKEPAFLIGEAAVLSLYGAMLFLSAAMKKDT